MASPSSCPVLILLHPFAGSRHSWITHAPELMTRLAEDCLVVMPECGRRWFIDDHTGARYEGYIIDDLLPAVRDAYRADGPASVGGFSMGGASAFFLALRHPELFASALAVAGAFLAANRLGDPYAAVRSYSLMIPTEAEHDRVWGPAGSVVRRRYDPATMVPALARGPGRPAFFFEVGRDDFPRMIDASLRMRELLAAAGVPFVFSQHAGDHGWDYAATGMARLVAEWRAGLS
jgi:S-formylglutathione hydrolase FrmB